MARVLPATSVETSIKLKRAGGRLDELVAKANDPAMQARRARAPGNPVRIVSLASAAQQVREDMLAQTVKPVPD